MNSEEENKRALLVLGGVLENHRIVSHLLTRTQLIVAADGGVRHLARFGLTPHVLIGDLDSASPQISDELTKMGTRIIHEREQESTDFEKALRWLRRQGYRDVLIVGIGGGRTDHLFTNISVMLRYATLFETLTAYDDTSVLRIHIPGKTLYIDREIGTRVSLIAIPVAKGVSTSGLQYVLHNEELSFGVRDGLGNRISGEHGASVTLRNGALLVSVDLEVHLRSTHAEL